MFLVRAAVLAVAVFVAPLVHSQYSTDFESFTLGDVDGQDGWSRENNSPTEGFVVPVPAGTPAEFGDAILSLVGAGNVGVQNHQTSAMLARPAGETGSLMNGGAVVDESVRETTFRATVWFRTPAESIDPYHGAERIAELNPASKAAGELDANRYAQVRIHKVQVSPGVFRPTVEIFWYAPANTVAPVGTLEWESWYRFEYEIELVDGTDGAAPNDRFVLSVFDLDGDLIGTACGSTWELGYRNNTWAGPTPGPLVVNAFDFWSYVETGVVAYHIDNFSMVSLTPPALEAAITGDTEACNASTTQLSVLATNESGAITTYEWRDSSDTLVGSGATFDAGAGTYTVTITDEACRTATSAEFVVTERAAMTASISGTTSVCFGGTTTLTANAAGGSNTFTSYTWRDATNAIVGTGTTFDAGAGTYTVTATDASCGPVTSAPVTVEVTCKATPVVSWSDPADIIYGTPLTATQLNATANVSGTFTYTPPAGTVLDAGADQILSVDFTPDDSANYEDVNGTTVQIDVLPATPTVTVTGGTFVYDGSAQTATAAAENAEGDPVSGSFTFAYDGSPTAPTDAGTYAVVASFTSSDPNYTDATGNGSLTIEPAAPTVTVTGGTYTYDGTPHAATAVARDADGDLVSGTFTFTYDGSPTAPTAAGTYAVVASFTSSDPNYADATGNGSLTIEPAAPTVTVTGGTYTYDGAPHAATAVARDADGDLVSGTFTFTYDGSPTAPTDAGTYAVVATFTSSDPNHTDATGNGSLTIEPAAPTVTVTGGTYTYDGTPHAATAVARDAEGDPVSGTFTFTYDGSSTAPTDAGTYAVVATFASSDPNHAGATGNGSLTIEPATPTVTVTGGTYTYDGAPHAATAVARNADGDPVSGTFIFTYDGNSTAPTNAGTYTVVATFTSTDPNHTDATGNGSLTIRPAATTIEITNMSPSPSERGESVIVTVALRGIVGTRGGTVTISNGSDSCTVAATSSSCSLTFPESGLIPVTATYSGDANHTGSTTSDTQTVGEAAAHAQVSRSASICSGASATIRVRLSGNAPWTITWSDGVVERVTESVHLRTVSPDSTTTYRLTGLADATGPGTTSGEAVITVTSVATPVITGPLGARVGEPLTLRATPGLGTYQWFRNGVAIPGATSDTLTIESLTESDLGSYTVVAASNGCVSSASVPFALVLLGLPVDDDAVIPVVGNAHGTGDSYFRTTVHLVNATEDLMEGEITFVDENLAPYPYSIAPGETRFIGDLLPESYEGLTSANVRRLRGPLPVVLAHVFNDYEALGTAGLIERAVPVGSALAPGDHAVLVTPIDPLATRFNVGLRSLSDGLSVRIHHRNAEGALLRTVEHSLPPSALIHEPVAELLGAPVGSSDSLRFEVLSGRGVIYGAATDNGTNDPNMQVASRNDAASSGRYVLPVAGSVHGRFGSQFATGLQIHNPDDMPLAAVIRFHPAGIEGSNTDREIVVTVAANATLAMPDVVAAIGAEDLGSIDVIVAGNMRPVLLARIYNIAEEGETSLMTELVPEADVLVTGDSGVIAAPAQPTTMRFNIGVRTLGAGVRMIATVRDPEGNVLRVVPLVFGPTWFVQTPAPSLLGLDLEGNESVVFTIEEGSAIVYGTWTDNVTQDPALQYAVRP